MSESMLNKMSDKAVEYEANGDQAAAERWLDKALAHEEKMRAQQQG